MLTLKEPGQLDFVTSFMDESGFFRWVHVTRAGGLSSAARSPTMARSLCCKAGTGPAPSFSGCVTSDAFSVRTGILGEENFQVLKLEAVHK